MEQQSRHAQLAAKLDRRARELRARALVVVESRAALVEATEAIELLAIEYDSMVRYVQDTYSVFAA